MAHSVTLSPPAVQAISQWLTQQRWYGAKGMDVARIDLTSLHPFALDCPLTIQLLRITLTPRTTTESPLPAREELYWTAWPAGFEPALCTSSSDIPPEITATPEFTAALWQAARHGQQHWQSPAWVSRDNSSPPPVGKLIHLEQSNSSWVFGHERADPGTKKDSPAANRPGILKLYRKLATGENPDAEICRYLQQSNAQVCPPLWAVLQIELATGLATWGMLCEYLPDCRAAWDVMGDLLHRVWSAATSSASGLKQLPTNTAELATFCQALAQKTAQMHLALARTNLPAFGTANWQSLNRALLADTQATYARQQFAILAHSLPQLPLATQDLANELLTRQTKLLDRFATWNMFTDLGERIRIHGDYHLGQVLVETSELGSGQNPPTAEKLAEHLWVIDFEGEPARPLADRQAKKSPLQDVAGMLRSLHYAVTQLGIAQGADNATVRYTQSLYLILAQVFWETYQQSLASSGLLPKEPKPLLDLLILEKAVYELGYELQNRPDWVAVPLTGLLSLLADPVD
ncbi:MAG: hypothetical protein SFX18_16630 [Pirellulales bacterium]|nr:hypothetical protein [Pirellulales bacterium]